MGNNEARAKMSLMNFIKWKDKDFYEEHKEEMEAMSYFSLEKFAMRHDFID